ncbi:MAG: type II toxin-antitoxin system VapC family toxin [Candidatus Chisholmbacteria bacterium]|nr:type II toxin-antitoxin system VapC family toxin [Candidatus Chisholmbacteria bacterium]
MILLDTHALLWWTDGAKELSERVGLAIGKEQRGGELGVSAISIWEICILVKAGRLVLRTDIDTWLADVMAIPNLEIVPIDADIAKAAVFLPNFPHKDPADRIIVATAMRLDVAVVTGDTKIREYHRVKTIW